MIIYAEQWVEEAAVWVPVRIEITSDEDTTEHAVKLSIMADDRSENLGLRFTADQSARLLVQVAEVLQNGQKR